MNEPEEGAGGGRLLITGATGFLGGCLVAQLLQTARWDDVLLLVRAATPEAGVGRVAAAMQRFEAPTHLVARILPKQIVCGDLTDVVSFGADPRLEDVTHVVNCAAVTSFSRHPRIWETNVEGTLAFAHRLRRLPHLRRFVQVGTALICGATPPAVVTEDDYPSERVKHFVQYTETKAEAELLLRQTLRDFPLVVVRPTIIVGHSELGCKPSYSIFWVFRLWEALRKLPFSIDCVIDVVPVDFVARSIHQLLFADSLRHSTYHLSAGPAASSSFREIGHAFARAMGKTDGDAYETVPFQDIVAMQDRFDAIFGRCNKRFMLKAMRLYESFASLNVTFSNQRLLDEGIAPPPRFTDYLDVCIRTGCDRSIPEQMLTDFA